MTTSAGTQPDTRPTSVTPAPRWYFWAGALLLAAGIATVFGTALRGEFLIWDDNINIFENPYLGGLSWERVRWAWTDIAQSFRFMPLGWMGYSAVFSAGGLDPAYFHAATLGMHLVNAVLLLVVLRLQLRITHPAVDAGWRELGAWLAAALWALHPLRVEVVAWALTLTYELAWCGLLLAWGCLLKFWVTERNGWIVATWASYTASLLAYPVGVSAWLAFLVLGWLLLRRGSGYAPAGWRIKLFSLAIPGALVTAMALWIRWHAAGFWAGSSGGNAMTLLERGAQTAYAWGYYLWRPWYPVNVAPIYGTLLQIDPMAGRFIVSGLLVAAGTLLGWLGRHRWPGFTAWWFATAALALPVMGLTEHPFFTSDRFTGLPSLALAAAVAGAWAQVNGRTGRWFHAAAATAWLAVLVGWSARQVPRWNNTTSLFGYVATITADPAVLAECHLRQALVAEADGKYAEARREMEQGLALEPYRRTLLALSGRLAAPPGVPQAASTQMELASFALSRNDAGAAEAHLRRAIQHAPRLREPRIRLGLLLLARHEPREAMGHFLWVDGSGAAGLDRQFLSAAAAAADEAGEAPLAQAVRRRL